MEFDAAYALLEALLGQYFYADIRLSVKLLFNNKGREDLTWDELVKKATRAKSKAKIQKNYDLDQQCPQGKWPLKLMKKNYNK